MPISVLNIHVPSRLYLYLVYETLCNVYMYNVSKRAVTFITSVEGIMLYT